jgi:hypothetical protein
MIFGDMNNGFVIGWSRQLAMDKAVLTYFYEQYDFVIVIHFLVRG